MRRAVVRKLSRELLERVNLSFAARRKVKSYSGGMRQRLGIAQAIAGNPRLIIVDEPTAGLDPEERLRFYRLLSELAADRIVLLSTHIVEDVAVLCPRFAVIRNGRLVANTTPPAARQAIEGTIYEGSIAAEEYERLVADPARCVTHAYLVEGRWNRVRLYEPDGNAPAGFAPARGHFGRRAISCRSRPAGCRAPKSLWCIRWAMVRRLPAPVPSEVRHHEGATDHDSGPCSGLTCSIKSRRPLFCVWAFVLIFLAFGLSNANIGIRSGDATVGGTKAYITSEFAVAMQLADLHDVFLLLFRRGGRGDDGHPGRGVAAG